jgi:hypothetical protein
VLLIPPAISGDFNRDGVVDAADYVVWRQTLNQTVTKGAGADANANGVVDQSDYDLWRAHFGNTTGAGAFDNRSAVPEPSFAALACVAAIGMSVFHPRNCGETSG